MHKGSGDDRADARNFLKPLAADLLGLADSGQRSGHRDAAQRQRQPLAPAMRDRGFGIFCALAVALAVASNTVYDAVDDFRGAGCQP